MSVVDEWTYSGRVYRLIGTDVQVFSSISTPKWISAEVTGPGALAYRINQLKAESRDVIDEWESYGVNWRLIRKNGSVVMQRRYDNGVGWYNAVSGYVLLDWIGQLELEV